MSLERFAVLFSGCGSSYKPGCRSTAGGALSRVEFAGLLAGLTEIEQNYFYAFFGDDLARVNLSWELYQRVLSIARREEWRGDEHYVVNIIRTMIATALDEMLDGRCHACNGTGLSKRVKVCASCMGSGVARLTDYRVASIVGIDRANYSRRWKQRYDRIFVIIQDIECSVKMKIRRTENKDAVLLA
jgi:hypothetical protein